MSLLSVRNLQVVYARRGRPSVAAVDGVDLEVRDGEIVGLVGETGCGKSTVARAGVGLAKATKGAVLLDGRPVGTLTLASRPPLNLRLQMVFQNPYSSLNPRRRIGDQIADGLRAIGVSSGKAQRTKVGDLLTQVGLPRSIAHAFPHQFSGGQRQRIAIARALAVEPRIVILDEPLSALDASAQSQIANLLVSLKQDLGVGMLLISHDLAILRHIADRIVVMYLGRVVEASPTSELWSTPLHPYTHALISAIPSIVERKAPTPLEGDIPDPAAPPSGCRFHTRCWLRGELGNPERCEIEDPSLRSTEPHRSVACHFAEQMSVTRHSSNAPGDESI